MANTKKTSTAGAGEAAALPEVTMTPADATRFEPFKWLSGAAPAEVLPAQLVVDLLNRTRDLAGGLGVVLAMLERDEIDVGSNDAQGRPLPRLFSPTDRGNLVRMSVAVCELISDTADQAIGDIGDLRDRMAGGEA
ncbi:MAG TPA: hypothetical protein PKC59_00900 [Burkholderiaceae bacterium]|nr:hypothetical protein [Burkholderiaceae bacterium]HMY99060.1 hypothetical protein [Burkholderiaceae bacterium]HNB43372.1 hypothetical protein [Burkholderiaceae bacterium]HNG77920.1 hypothetical protein [Burkholderiaceae bacterium]